MKMRVIMKQMLAGRSGNQGQLSTSDIPVWFGRFSLTLRQLESLTCAEAMPAKHPQYQV